MKELIDNSVYIGVLISLASYALGVWLRKKTGLSFFNPLLVSIILVILFLSVSGISYSTYAESADYISFLLTPATICLAVPLYEQFKLLKELEGSRCRYRFRSRFKPCMHLPDGTAFPF